MREYFIKSHWPVFPRYLYYFLLALFGLTLLSAVFLFFYPNSFVFPLEKVLAPDIEPVKYFNFLTPFGDFSPALENLIIFQRYELIGFELPIWPARIFNVFLFLFFTVITTIVIRLHRWWFFGSLGAIILLATFLQIHEFGLFGLDENYILIALMLLIAMVIFILHDRFLENSFKFHFIASAILWALLWAVIIVFSSVTEPLVQISNYSLPAALIFCIAFVIFIGHEPIHLFFVMISYSANTTSRGRVINFLVISLLWLGNAVLTYLHNTNRLDWDIFYTPILLFILFSMIAGFYGFKKRIQNSSIMRYESAGAITYLLFCTFFLAFWSYAKFAEFDAALEVIDDAVLYGQLAMGGMFLLYLLVNFSDYLNQNKKVYKIVFKPQRLPLNATWLGGLVGVTALFLYSNVFPYWQARGAAYIAIADNHQINGQTQMSEIMYEQGSVFAYGNRRSNANLGIMYEALNNMPLSASYLTSAQTKNSSPEIGIARSAQFIANNKIFDALFALQDAQRDHPSSEAVNNNLGLLFAGINTFDSAYIYFQKTDAESRERNISGLLAKSGRLDPDSLPPQDKNDLGEAANRIGIYNSAFREFTNREFPNMLADSTVTFDEFGYTHNLFVNQLLTGQKPMPGILDAYLSAEIGQNYLRDLHLLRGLAYSERGRMSEALADFELAQTYSGVSAGQVSKLAGTVLWQKGLIAEAIVFMDRASSMNYQDAQMQLFGLYIEAKKIEQASEQFKVISSKIEERLIPYWEDILNSELQRPDVAELPSELQYAAFQLHGNRWRNKDLMDFPKSLLIPGFQDKVAATIYNELIIRNEMSMADQFFNKWNEDLYEPSQLNEAYLTHLYYENPEGYLAKYATLKVSSKRQALFDAWAAKIKGDETTLKEAMAGTKYLQNDPEVLLLKIENGGASITPDAAYQMLLNQLRLTPNHVGIIKAYIQASIVMGLESYADAELKRLSSLISTEALEIFKSKTDSIRAKFDNQNW